MNPHSTSLLQRIQEGLPLQVRVGREQATIEDGEGRRSHFPILPAEIPPLEGIYEAAFEVAQDGRFLTAGEISARPLKAWLGYKQAAARLVINRNVHGEPPGSVPFELEGIETVARPTLMGSMEKQVWRIACLLPCHEVRIFTQTGERSWKVLNQADVQQKPLPAHAEPAPERLFHDRFSELAAALPSQPTARPYGSRRKENRRPKEDWEGFRMGKVGVGGSETVITTANRKERV